MSSDSESSVVGGAPEPPVFRALYDGDAEALRDALADGADPDATNSNGYTALLWLVKFPLFHDELARLACMSALLEAGAEPNISSGPHYERGTPMRAAVFRLRSQPAVSRAVVSLLLRHGADVNLGSEMGLTPLHIASIFGCCEIIPVLLAAGADVNAILSETLGR